MSFVQDLRFALRQARKNLPFTSVVVATLGLGIGANTAVFSVVDAALFRPLPYPEPDRLALVERRTQSPRGEGRQLAHDGRTWEALRAGAHQVRLAAFMGWTTGVNLAIDGQVELVRQQRIGAGFFEILGVAPLLGREFTPDEDRPGGPRVALLSHALWSRLWNRNPSVLGNSVLLRGEPHTVVGVLPAGLHTGVAAEIWTPLMPTTTGEGSGANYQIVGRLRDGVGWERAEAEIESLGRAALEVAPLPPDVVARFGLEGLRRARAVDVRSPLLLLWGAVGVILLVACVNVAGMLLAKAAERRREIGARLALGASRGAIARQLLIESALHALLGAAAGVGLALLSLRAAAALAGDSVPLLASVALDVRVLAGASAIAALACLLSGVWPAVRASRLDVRLALSEARSGASLAGKRSKAVLVVAQVGATVVLLTGAFLLSRSFVHLVRSEPGLDPSNVLSATLSLDDARYASRDRVDDLFRQSHERLEAVPGIETAAASLGLPFERSLNISFTFEGEPADEPRITQASYVTPGFFEVLRIPLLFGRVLTERDRSDSPSVVVVSRAFAETYLSDADVLGDRIVLGGETREIVGVVGDVLQSPSWGSAAPLAALPAVYLPLSQTSDDFLALVHSWFAPSLLVRSSEAPSSLEASVRDAVTAVDPLLPVASFRTLDDVKTEVLTFPKLLAFVLAGFGGLAVLLTGVGVYGIVSQSVLSESRAICIRMAMGATVARAMATAIRPVLLLAAVGTAVGTVLAWLLAPVLRGLVWGVDIHDPATLASVATGALVVAFMAAAIPASRIARLSPAERLRED